MYSRFASTFDTPLGMLFISLASALFVVAACAHWLQVFVVPLTTA
jgi:hypothetical protein